MKSAARSTLPHAMGRGAMAVAAAAALVGVAMAPAVADEHTAVVASGLNSPRNLSFAPNGDLYIAESGAPSEDAAPCVDHPEFGQVCLAHTSSISLLSRHGVQSRPVTGLPALVNPEEAVGASDVVLHGNVLSVAMGLGGTPDLRDALGDEAAPLGTVVDIKQNGPNASLSVRADLAAYEDANDPDGAGSDSNPVAVTFDGRDLLAVDAGANAVLGVGKKGGVSEFAVFAEPVLVDPPPFPAPPELPGGWPDPFPAQSVPTDVAKGPDGAWYVSELTGFPFQAGAATIWRVAADGSRTAYATGLTNVTSLAWNGDTLYAVQISDGGLLGGPIGSLQRVDPAGAHETVVGGLFAPYGVAIRAGHAYVTTGSVLPGGGEVLKVALG
jgi:hypothetical protein